MAVINRLAPLPYESLVGYMERLRQANYYDEAGWWVHATDIAYNQQLYMLRHADHFRALSDLTGLTVDALFSMTLHRFLPYYRYAEEIGELERQYGDLDRPLWEQGNLFTFVGAQPKICPHCWDEQKTLLLPWMLNVVTSCPKHDVLLVSHCPGCKRMLRLNLMDGSCRYCKHPIARMNPVSVAAHGPSVQLAALIWSAIGCSNDSYPPPALLAALPPTNPLRLMDALTLLHFFRSFARILVLRDPDHTLWQGVPEEAIPILANSRSDSLIPAHTALAGTWALLKDWDSLWNVTLERIAEREAGMANINRRLPATLMRLFRGPNWEWLHNDWGGFIRDNAQEKSTLYSWLRFYREDERRKQRSEESGVAAELGEQGMPALLSQREAARELGVNEQSIKTLIDTGELQATAPPPMDKSRRRQWRLVTAESVARLKTDRAALLTLAQAAGLCGVPESQVTALVAAGLLEAETGPMVDGASIWAFREHALREGLTNILGSLPLCETAGADKEAKEDAFLLTLQDALRLTSWEGVGLPQLLVAIKGDLLDAFRIECDQVNLECLRFARAGLLEFLARRRKTVDGRMVFSANDACRLLRCKPVTLRRLYAAGLLVPCVDETRGSQVHWRYYQKDVEEFIERYINTFEVAEILGVHYATVTHWAGLGITPAVTGPRIDGSQFYRFDREAVIKWRVERLTIMEARELLQVSKNTMSKLVHAGKIHKLYEARGGASLPCYLRSDVEALKAVREQRAQKRHLTKPSELEI